MIELTGRRYITDRKPRDKVITMQFPAISSRCYTGSGPVSDVIYNFRFCKRDYYTGSGEYSGTASGFHRQINIQVPVL